MDARIQKMRERLAKQGEKISREQAIYAEMERDIKKAEDEQLGFLARSAANTLSGGMEELFELLRGLRAKPDTGADNANTINPENNYYDENKEGEIVDDTDETEV